MPMASPTERTKLTLRALPASERSSRASSGSPRDWAMAGAAARAIAMAMTVLEAYMFDV